MRKAKKVPPEEEKSGEIEKDWDDIQNTIQQTELIFEQKLTYISAGTLVLSLTFIEKIVSLEKSNGIWFLIFGWIFLGSTLIINLASQMISKKHLKDAQNDIYDDLSFEKRKINIDKNNNKINKINKLTIITMTTGIFLIIIFTSINSFIKTNSNPITNLNTNSTENKNFNISIPNELIKKNDSLISIHFIMEKGKSFNDPEERGISTPSPRPSHLEHQIGHTVPQPRPQPNPQPSDPKGK